MIGFWRYGVEVEIHKGFKSALMDSIDELIKIGSVDTTTLELMKNLLENSKIKVNIMEKEAGMRRRKWSSIEVMALIDTYEKHTIKELEDLFPERSRESINNKIKRLKLSGKIKDGKTDDTIKRAYSQRGENY